MNLKRFFRSLVTKVRLLAQGLPTSLNPDKKVLIDYLYQHCNPAPRSFADLGGVWNVDGVYTFYVLQRYGAGKAVLVDTDLTASTVKKSQSNKELRLVAGNFGDESVAEQVGTVDAIFLFDVLLHQVKPDWNEILKSYSTRTNYFVVFNQQWTGSEHTIRLLDLGRDEYFRNVPHDKNHPTYKALFEKMNEMHPQHNRAWRDIHNVWQWGITDRDLTQAMEKVGFKMKYYKNCGRFKSLPNFENHAFIFQKE